MQQISGKILGISDQINNFGFNLNFKENPFSILDIFLVALIIYSIYLIIKETKAIRIVYGIIILALIMLAGQLLQLSALNFILKYLVTMILVAIPIVFQPELRAFLEKLGRARIVADFSKLRKSEIEVVVEDLVKSVKILSQNSIGALIVLVQKTGLKDYVDTGIKLDAALSPELLLTIFHPKTPLHDGAVIISGNKIVAASCILPLSEDQYDYDIGTRHKAAIGLSQQTDALVIVVSEERGTISIAYNGQLSKEISPKELEEFIYTILYQRLNKKK
jgi:diadenylate cyclase